MKFLVLFALVLVSGCTSTVPRLNQYLLRSDASSQFSVEQQSAVVGLGAVVVAPYIDSLGLVQEKSSGEVRAARDHQWAEPLRASLRVFMAREISAHTGQTIRAHDSGESDWQRRIDLRIDQLHGTASGEATLVAYWQVFDMAQRSVVSENGFAESQALGADGYEALVAVEKALLGKLAAAMAASL
ncbi:MAG: membrane integrity-associated transporter subunit PqiC [Porticoccaceae bacterium]|nr:membrane integrity-associated transporter subunit PqiC [Porticoccaceae bacterium]